MSVEQAWIAGALHGDAWCSRLTLGLRVKDEDFARAFAAAVNLVEGTALAPKVDERGYWLTRIANARGQFDHLKRYGPVDDLERAAWLRGLFDSEGNAQLIHRPTVSPGTYARRVSFYSTDRDTLARAAGYLGDLGLSTVQSEVKATIGHKGTKPVFELRLAHSRESFALFAARVGSSIERKRSVLDAIPGSYQPPGHHARMQARGAATKRARTDSEVLPRVLAAMAKRGAAGEKMTQRACGRAISGYWTVWNHYGHSELVRRAEAFAL